MRRALVVLALASTAHADSAKLAAARAAVDAVHYDEAQTLLVGALADGGNSPAALAEIYRLSASTALVLGKRDVAEQYYRRWLALDPDAKLADDVAPKLREPFDAARAYMAAHGRLTVKPVRRSPTDVELVVASDPLAMAVAAALAASSGAGGAPVPFGADRVARLSGAAITGAVVLDEFGNHLIELSATELGGAPSPAAPGRASDLDRAVAIAIVPGVPFYRQPLTWAIPAIALVSVGMGFSIAADKAQQDLENVIRESSPEHYLSEADAIRKRRDRDALIANIGYVSGGACAVVAVVMYLTRPHATVVTPTSSGIALAGAW